MLTKTAAGGDDADGKGAMFVKVGGHNGKTGYKYHAGPNTDANTLSEEGLVVLLDQTSHHETENDEKGPEGKEGAVVSGIKNRACESTNGQEEETLCRADPGDGRGCMGGEKIYLIEVLISTESVDDAPAVEEDRSARPCISIRRRTKYSGGRKSRPLPGAMPVRRRLVGH